jgi:4-carboxymuconolactone decarboxylase
MINLKSASRSVAVGLGLLHMLAAVAPAGAQDRLPPVSPDKYTAEQKQRVAEYKALRHEDGPGGGPYVVLMRSPEAYIATAALSAYLRFKSPIGLKLTEFVSLISAYHMKARFQYGARYTGSLREGVKKDVLDAIGQGRRPDNMPEDEAIAYDFCTELHVNKYVSDATYARALRKFGERGVVDITAISGYYAYIAMLTNMARTPAGNQDVALPPTFPRWADKP